MKKFAIALIAALVAGASSPAAAQAVPPVRAGQPPVDAAASAATVEVLDWLSDLPTRSDTRVVIGQYVTRNLNNTSVYSTASSAWQYFYNDLATATGKYPGIAGFDFSQRAQNGAGPNTPDDSNWRAYAQTHWDAGGLIKIMWHAPNPWTGSHSWSAIPAGSTLSDIITPGNPAYDNWTSWLATVGDRLQWYEDHDIPVLWGPLHEANGGWFWWGGGTSAQYTAVWQHMYDYLTTTRGLHNLLWNYSPDAKASLSTAISRYPGNGYVDIISPDMYYTSASATASIAMYNEFAKASYGKVLGWGEVGTSANNVDNRKYINEIRSSMPKMTFYMQWMDVTGSTNFSINSNPFKTEVMQDPWIITRDEVLAPPPNPPSGLVTIDDADPSMTYAGSWVQSPDGGYLNGTKSVSAASGSTATFAFSGTAVQLFARTLPSGGRFDVYVDGLKVGTADTYAPVDQYQVQVFEQLGLAPGSHTVQLQLAGQKHASSTGYWVGLDFVRYAPVPATTTDDASSAVTYAGSWTHSSDPAFFAGTKSVSNAAGSSASLTFTGTTVAVYARTLPAGGQFDVYLDGGFAATVDTYSASGAYQTEVYRVSGLGFGPHTIEVRLNGQKNPASTAYWVGLDHFVYQ